MGREGARKQERERDRERERERERERGRWIGEIKGDTHGSRTQDTMGTSTRARFKLPV